MSRIDAFVRFLACVFLLAALTFSSAKAQTISSSISGTVLDSSGSTIAGARVVLINEATGAELTGATNETGIFRFPVVPSGQYSVNVTVTGFKSYAKKNISLASSEKLELGAIMLQLGDIKDTVQVTGEATPVQVASAEKSALITGTQMNNITMKGRDFLAIVSLTAGVVDAAASRDAPATFNSTGQMSVNGGRGTQTNVAIDGVSTLDTGSTSWSMGQPNMETIAEVRVLTSNYQAEYGRNASGVISVITKSGTRSFHGSGWWQHRHEEFNATDFFRNKNGLVKAPYRYNIPGYSIGGPVYIPGRLNKDKNRLFFFFSEEYTRRWADYGSSYVRMPTALERQGDFTQTRDAAGNLLVITDPLTSRPFAGNQIPASRINNWGSAMLNIFPKPNYTPADQKLIYTQNFSFTGTGQWPHRDDVLRLDANITSKHSFSWRLIRDSDLKNYPTAYGIFRQEQRYVTDSNVFHLTSTFSPTLVNEFVFGMNKDALDIIVVDPASVATSRLGTPPRLYAIEANNPLQMSCIPNISFGSIPSNSPAISFGFDNCLYHNFAHINSFSDNLSLIIGKHNLKFGAFLERDDKTSPQDPSTWRGAYNFGRDANNPYDTGTGLSNALLGSFASYAETKSRFYYRYTNATTEWFVQDSWRATRRLTIDLGVRFTRFTPWVTDDPQMAGFDRSTYDRAKAPRLYTPGLDASGKRAGVDRITGTTVPASLIGFYVPNSGDIANGLRVGGVNGYPKATYTWPAFGVSPRIGFAWDVFGSGKTAVRGGFGQFYNVIDGNNTVNTIGNPPVSFTPTAYYGNISTLGQSAGNLGPSNLNCFYYGSQKYETVMNFSFGIQQAVGFSSVFDVAYVGSLGRHLSWIRDVNAIPMFARFDAQNMDPTNPGKPLPDNFLRPYYGLATLGANEFAATSNYHSLQASLQRRFGHMTYGAAYTFSKALGTANTDRTGVSPYLSPRQRNYGPISFDRPNNFVLNYVYDLPDPGKRLGNKWLGAVTDHWSLSGVTRFMSGAPFLPGMSTTSGVDISGSTEGARISVVGDPNLAKSERDFYRNFKTEAFALTPVRSLGNAGVGILHGPGINNWDISAAKRMPVGLGEQRTLQLRVEFYNAFNHTQFAGYDATALFDATGKQVSPTFGSYNSSRTPRNIAFTLRFQF